MPEAPTLTYPQFKALTPCEGKLRETAKRFGGARKCWSAAPAYRIPSGFRRGHPTPQNTPFLGCDPAHL